MDFVKKTLRLIYESVVVSHKSTLIGWGIGAGIVVADQAAQALAGWHSPYAPLVATLVGLAGSALRNREAIEAKRAEAPVAP